MQFSRRLRSGNCSELVCALSASGSMCRQRQDDGYCLCVFFCAFSRAGAICKTRVDHGEIHAAAFSVLTRRIVPVINGSGGAGPRCRRDVDARLEFIDITQADRDKHSIKRPSLPGPGSRSCAPSSSRSPRRAASRASAIESRSRRPIASGRGRTRTCASRG